MFKLFIVCVVFNFQFIFCSIYTIQDLDEAGTEIENVDTDTLVVFDINDVLILPKDQILRSYAKPYRLKLMEKHFYSIDEHQILGLTHQILLYKKTNYQLVDHRIPLLINQMQQKGAKVVALTSGKRESEGLIDDLEDIKIQILSDLGIDFQTSFPEMHSLILQGAQFNDHPPVFKQGILFARPYDKGLVLEAFLANLPDHPKKVLLFDNKMKNLKSVAEVMDATPISFIGFCYLAVEQLSHQIDQEIAEFQYRYLVEYGEWLGEEQVKLLIKEKHILDSAS